LITVFVTDNWADYGDRLGMVVGKRAVIALDVLSWESKVGFRARKAFVTRRWATSGGGGGGFFFFFRLGGGGGNSS
jgi:hypothetical protein